MNLGELEFKSEDCDRLSMVRINGEWIPEGEPVFTVECANRILREKLEKAKTVYLIHKEDWEPLAWVEGAVLSRNDIAFSHTARLVCIEEIK